MAEPARKYDNNYTVNRPRVQPPVRDLAMVNTRRERKRRTPGYIVAIKGSGRNKFLRVLVYLTILFGALLFIFSKAYMESRKMELSTLERELNRLRVENTVLRSQIHDTFDLLEVERYATGVLGMVRPDESQFVYVDEVRLGYAVRHVVEDEVIRPIDILGDMFRTIFGFIRTE
jgi:cell division protein FtsB